MEQIQIKRNFTQGSLAPSSKDLSTRSAHTGRACESSLVETFLRGSGFWPCAFLGLPLLASLFLPMLSQISLDASFQGRDSMTLYMNATTTGYSFSPEPSPLEGKQEANGGQGAGTGDALTNYLGQIIARVEQHKRYPRRERMEGIEGSVRLQFTVGKDGSVQNLQIVKPSSISSFNAEALETVKRASPFPAIPTDLKRSTMIVPVKLIFELERE